LAPEVRGRWFPFEMSHFEGPSYYGAPPFRVLFHELLHFWQTISTNFLASVAVSEWQALLDYEATGKIAAFPEISRRLHAPDPESGFAPNDLIEALARYWDVHVLGPERILAWDRAEIEAANQGGTPLLGYTPREGGA